MQRARGRFVHDVDLNSVQKFNSIVEHDQGGVVAIVISLSGNQVCQFGEEGRPADDVVGSVVYGLVPLKQRRIVLEYIKKGTFFYIINK